MPVIPAIWEAEIKRSYFKANLGKKLVKFFLKEQAGHR
jgi:hypothetical protein